MTQKLNKIAGGRTLARNSVANLLGMMAPLLVAFFALPMLIKSLGTDRFGVLSLVWLVIGYFGLFDMGIGRALTKFVAEKLGTGDENDIPSIVSTGMLLMLALGLAGAVVCYVASPWLVYSVLKIPSFLQAESLRAFHLLSISIPIVISVAGMRGVLEAYQRFDLINIIRIPMGVFNYLGAVLALKIGNDLVTVVIILLIGRLVGFFAYCWFCSKVVPQMFRKLLVHRDFARKLITFGSWLTVSGIIGPLMGSLDRFMLGAWVSVSAVAYYSTPYEMITKMRLIPTALTGVLFPAFSASLDQHQQHSKMIFQRGVKYLFLALFPAVLIIVTFADEGMTLWLGQSFSQNSYRVLQLLAAGVLINSLSQVPHALITGGGRPDLVPKLHMVELPVYLFSAWFMTERFGIIGMAMTWALRVTIDNLLIFVIAGRVFPEARSVGSIVFLTIAFSLGLLAVAASLNGIVIKAVFAGLVLASCAFWGWRSLLAKEEKDFLFSFIGLHRS